MKNILFLFLILLSTNILAQSNKEKGLYGNIRGFVYDKGSGEPIMFCNVVLKETTTGSTTDINGMYNISKIQAGTYTLIVKYLGYDTKEVLISIFS